MTHCTNSSSLTLPKASRAVILAGAPQDHVKWIAPLIKHDDLLLCADSGARIAHALDITPHLLTGDFDSLHPDLLQKYTASEKTQVLQDTDQNCTDLQKILRLIPDEIEQITIIGAIGARFDHTFANILTLMQMDNPARFALRDENQKIILADSDYHFSGEIGDYVGVFPLRPITNLHYEGLEFTPDALGGPYDFGWIGSSNRMTAPNAAVLIDNGLAMITQSYST